MNETELRNLILTALKQIAPDNYVDDLKPDDNLRQMLDLDSFDHLNFLIGISSQLGIDIPEKDYGKLDSLAKIIDYLTVKAV
ncbi:MAG TPA: acyl carrier protein [Anaerolineales bacterium]